MYVDLIKNSINLGSNVINTFEEPLNTRQDGIRYICPKFDETLSQGGATIGPKPLRWLRMASFSQPGVRDVRKLKINDDGLEKGKP